MGYLDIKSLVITDTELKAAQFTAVARKADYRGYDIETAITNVLSRLQDPIYQAFFLYELGGTAQSDDIIFKFLARLRSNLQTKQIPIIVICNEPMMENGQKYYENGVQFVIDKISAEKLIESLLITDSWINFCNQFKEGREKFFRR